MLEQLLLSFGINISSGLVLEGIKQLFLRNPSATKSDVKKEISKIISINDDNKVEQTYNSIQGNQKIENGSIIFNSNQSGGQVAHTIINNVDSVPAEFSESHSVLPVNGLYNAIVKIVANKQNNLPALLCVQLKTDANIIHRMGPVIKNDGIPFSQIINGNNFKCISNPSKNITANFLLDKNPTIFEISFSTQIPKN